MKKIILAIMFCTSLVFPSAFAGDDSIDIHIANTLSVLFKITDKNSLMNINGYHETTFVYNGMPVTAFKSNTGNWVGFYKKLSANNLPENSLQYIKSKYKGCIINDVTMYFSNGIDINYFAEISVNNKCIVLKIQPSGKIKNFKCMSRHD